VDITVKKLRKPAIVDKIAPSGNLKLAGRKIVSVTSVGNKNAFAGICTRSEYFASEAFHTRVSCKCPSTLPSAISRRAVFWLHSVVISAYTGL